MVIGPGSESYRTLRYLVERLPAMIAPAWLRNRTQPIDIDDVLAYLVQAAERPETAGREIQIGGPDVVTYADLIAMMAEVLGLRRRPQLPVPLLTPRLSSLWIGLVTPVDAGVARAAGREPGGGDDRHRPVRRGALRRRAGRGDGRAAARRRGRGRAAQPQRGSDGAMIR